MNSILWIMIFWLISPCTMPNTPIQFVEWIFYCRQRAIWSLLILTTSPRLPDTLQCHWFMPFLGFLMKGILFYSIFHFSRPFHFSSIQWPFSKSVCQKELACFGVQNGKSTQVREFSFSKRQDISFYEYHSCWNKQNRVARKKVTERKRERE